MKNAVSFSPIRLKCMRPTSIFLLLAGSCFCCFGQLPANLDLPSETLNSGNVVYQASNSITNSGSNFVVQDPASVTLTAGSSITLAPGFDAVATTGTATFQAVINPDVVNWQPIPVPSPPTACTNCGEDFALAASSGISPQATFAPSSSNTLYAYCLDENADVVPCDLSLSIASYLKTNGHFHDSPLPPTSSISPSSGYTGDYPDWNMPVTLTTTQIGQFETVSVTPTDCDNGEEGETCIETNYDYAVGYSSLVYIANSNIFYQTGGNTTDHGDNTFNHWMTVNAATGLQQATTAYLNQYNPGQKVCINDIALPIGGKFDICWSSAFNCKDKNGNPVVNPWGSPHASHDQGTAVDVAATTNQCNQSNTVNIPNFRQACSFAGASKTFAEGSHAHCQWPN